MIADINKSLLFFTLCILIFSFKVGFFSLGSLRGAVEAEEEADRPEEMVVIDPGHGGEDGGARGRGGTLEKTVALEAARILAEVMRERLGLRVELTRTDDRAMPLEMRAARANTSRAVLFLSLHAGGAFNPERSEALVFSLKPLLDPPMKRADDWNDPVGLTPWHEVQLPFVLTSRRLAESLQDNLNLLLQQEEGRKRRMAKGAPLAVLMGAKMPAALVELGCLNNPKEEARLNNTAYLRELSEALVDGIRQYRAGVADSLGER